jgi:hypothetical protein
MSRGGWGYNVVPRPKAPEVTAAMELLLTRRQIEAVSDMTAGGRSKLEAIRELINWGIAVRERDKRTLQDKVLTVLKTDLDRRSNLGESIVIKTTLQP